MNAAADANTIQQILAQAKNKLQFIAADQAALEAEILLAHLLNQPRSFLFAHANQQLSQDQIQQYNDLTDRRVHGEPVAYIVGKKEFWSLTLTVTPDTLIPRPETELMVEIALDVANNLNHMKIADLGTGSGAIALALASERPQWQVYATDQHEEILQVASKNAHDLEINNISFHCGNWCTALPCQDFDMIISNPPYIALTEWEDYSAGLAYEPLAALVSGQDGLDAIRTISQQAKQYLRSGGWLLIEHGFAQGTAVRKIFEQNGYENIRTIQDLAGHERITIGASKAFFGNAGKLGLQLISG